MEEIIENAVTRIGLFVCIEGKFDPELARRLFREVYVAGKESVEMPPIYNVDTSLLKRELKDGVYVDTIGSIEVRPL